MTHPGRAVAERIGRVGLWTFQFDVMPVADVRRAAARIEEMGAGAIWIPESVVSKEVFAHSTLLLAATERIPVATGIANIWARDAVAMRNGARTLADAFPGRFILGLGVSHEPAVTRRGGTHPVAYVALGSHANWLTSSAADTRFSECLKSGLGAAYLYSLAATVAPWCAAGEHF